MKRSNQGVRFARAFSNNTWTLASTGSLMTGRLQENHGAVTNLHRLDEDARTLASYGLDGDGGDRDCYSLQLVLIGPMTFTYESDFDENGLLYYIGTGEGAGEPYANPAEAGRIGVRPGTEARAGPGR